MKHYELLTKRAPFEGKGPFKGATRNPLDQRLSQRVRAQQQEMQKDILEALRGSSGKGWLNVSHRQCEG